MNAKLMNVQTVLTSVYYLLLIAGVVMSMTSTPMSLAFYHASMRISYALAAACGRAGMRAELAYRQAVDGPPDMDVAYE